MEESLDWLRNNDPDTDKDEPKEVPTRNLGSTPLPEKSLLQQQKAKDQENALNWLRNKGANIPQDEPDKAGINNRQTSTGEPPAGKVRKAFDWLRSCTGNDGLTPYGVGQWPSLSSRPGEAGVSQRST
jgi:hypothetical protein